MSDRLFGRMCCPTRPHAETSEAWSAIFPGRRCAHRTPLAALPPRQQPCLKAHHAPHAQAQEAMDPAARSFASLPNTATWRASQPYPRRCRHLSHRFARNLEVWLRAASPPSSWPHSSATGAVVEEGVGVLATQRPRLCRGSFPDRSSLQRLNAQEQVLCFSGFGVS